MKPHYPWIIILLGALLIVVAGKGQFPSADSMNKFIAKHGTYPFTNRKFVKSTRLDTASDLNVMLKIVLRRKPSYHFYREGYKRGEEYWIISGNKIRPLPKSWFVWEYRIIKK